MRPNTLPTTLPMRVINNLHKEGRKLLPNKTSDNERSWSPDGNLLYNLFLNTCVFSKCVV